MGNSFAHALGRLGELDSSKAFHRAILEQDVQRRPAWTDANGRTWPAAWSPFCQGRGCDERPTHVTRYRYVTGRKGRTTDRIQYACPLHAEAFARRHGLAWPAGAAA